MTNLLIVESPAKCKKIQGFLGAGWRVQATMGHIRALKEELEAIGFNAAAGTQQSWRPTYELIATKKTAIAALRSAAQGATVYLGSDDDREGEAIAWHTCHLLGLDPATTPRVVFHEITEPALRTAVGNPKRIDLHKFNAQQARTMLDMLIGFTLSPCLWRGVQPGLSAGRCQTPALRIIYDRDREIEGHQATNTWRLTATTEDAIEDSTLEWRDSTVYATAADVEPVLRRLAAEKPKTVVIQERQERIATSQPPKPFITSTLQQEASSRLGMQPKTTMRAAQTLYEAGHITYMRTDNAILSQEAIDAASAVVRGRWGEEFLGGVAPTTEGGAKKKVVRKKAAAAPAQPEAQAAHEGIRPTHMEHETIEADSNERRLYDLIWRRTLQSVMAPEQRDVVRLTGVAAGIQLTTEWDQVRFAGWRVLDHPDAGARTSFYEQKTEEEQEHEMSVFAARADLVADVALDWQTFVATEVRSAPAGRYTEAALIRELEHRGIGRPSTYATLVETVLDRSYVEKATIPPTPVKLGVMTLTAAATQPKTTTRTEKVGGEKDKLRTTALGRTVIEWLLANFGDMVEYDMTAAMEAQLDEVSKGSRAWNSVLTEAWTRYADRYAAVMATPRAAATADAPVRLANKVDFGDGYKMIVSKKGPLFVHEQEGQATRFASVPPTLSLQTATRADAESAFSAAQANTQGTPLGDLDGKPVVVRKGQYGFYASWGDVRLNCTAEDTLATLTPKLQAKVSGDAVDHQVGAYKIKRGPYGLYMFKTGGKTKPTFVGIPDTTPYTTLTPEGAEQLYKHCATAKKDTGGVPKKPRAKKE
jgi:DNA topoisomerase-1